MNLINHTARIHALLQIKRWETLDFVTISSLQYCKFKYAETMALTWRANEGDESDHTANRIKTYLHPAKTCTHIQNNPLILPLALQLKGDAILYITMLEVWTCCIYGEIRPNIWQYPTAWIYPILSLCKSLGINLATHQRQ